MSNSLEKIVDCHKAKSNHSRLCCCNNTIITVLDNNKLSLMPTIFIGLSRKLVKGFLGFVKGFLVVRDVSMFVSCVCVFVCVRPLGHK